MVALELALALIAVTGGAELLVRGAVSLALRAGVSTLFVGLTVVGFGTSSPELGASLSAGLRGLDDVGVGNVLGSNIFNIGVILGVTAFSRPILVSLAAVRRDLRIALLVSPLPLLALLGGGRLTRPLGALFIVALVSYLVVAYRKAREEPLPGGPPVRRGPVLLDLLWVGLGLVALVFGSQLLIGVAVDLARAWGIPELTIGLTLVAAGTSLPELVTSLVAARRGHPDLAVGNVIGSNIFNVLGILGVCSLVIPQRVAPAVLAIDVPVLCLFTVLLFPLFRTGSRVSRGEGLLLMGLYGVYLSTLLLLRS